MSKTLNFVVMASVLALVGCKQQETVQEEIRPVRTITVGVASGANALALSGEVRARYETALAFRVGGKLTQRLVDVGAVVKAGQALARLDPKDLALSVQASRAQSDAARADLEQAKLDLVRAQELFAKKFVSQAEVDRRLTAMTAAQSKLEQAEAQQHLSGNQASYATLVADAAGVVTSVDADAGQVVAAGQSVVRLARDGEREVVVDVAENQRASISVGQSAEISVWALPGKTYTGKVREVAPAADSQTRTYRVRVALDAVESEVRIGMSATLKLALDQSPVQVAATVPLSAIFGQGQVQRVWLLDQASGRVKSVVVNVLGFEGESVRLSGLKQGDVVVTAGVHLLREGQPVRNLRSAVKSGNQ